MIFWKNSTLFPKRDCFHGRLRRRTECLIPHPEAAARAAASQVEQFAGVDGVNLDAPVRTRGEALVIGAPGDIANSARVAAQGRTYPGRQDRLPQRLLRGGMTNNQMGLGTGRQRNYPSRPFLR